MLEPRHLQQVLVLAHHGHFGRAARALGISQPALSRSIQTLELRLGVPLFERTGHGAVLTRVGGRLVERADALLQDLAMLERELRSHGGLTDGFLKVSAGPYPAELSVTPAIGRLVARHPDLSVELRVTHWRQVTEDVRAGVVDLGVAEMSEVRRDDGLEVEAMGTHRLVLFCAAGHPLLGQRRELGELLAFPWVATKVPPRMAEVFPADTGRAFSRDSRTGDLVPRILVSDTSLARCVVRDSLAIGAATRSQIQEELDAGSLAVLPFDAPWLRLRYGFILPRGRWRSPAAERLMEEVRTIEAGISAA
jgi:DNA-binding transcriptional LysR family regulator